MTPLDGHHGKDEHEGQSRHGEIELPELIPSHSKLFVCRTSLYRILNPSLEKAAQFTLPGAGRVNLIGDHTDYNGLPVFPMAVQRRFRILFRSRTDNLVRATTVDGYAERTFSIATEIEPYDQGDWGNYVKASARILARRYGSFRTRHAAAQRRLPWPRIEFIFRIRGRQTGSRSWHQNQIDAPFKELIELFRKANAT